MTTAIKKQQQRYANRLNQVGSLIGQTPLYRIGQAFQKRGVEIYAKLEWKQLGGSVKARPAFQIIKSAIEKGDLYPGKTLVDATSGNTGIAYATIGAALGIPVALCLPADVSAEIKLILQSLGAKIIYTPKAEGMAGAQLRAKSLAEEFPDEYYSADQYTNEQNWKAHFHGTAVEIWEQTQGRVTHFITGLGTTGTFLGTGRRLKLYNPAIELVALQPNTSKHGLKGWNYLEPALVQKVYDAHLADQFMEADTQEAYTWIRWVARKEGLILSPSAAANLAGAVALADKIDQGVIVTNFADDATKYSTLLHQILNP
ncbi:MAG: PLP-dependent cysteine synthase family protein [Saprospiraceae bacterium]